jgi:uncharacterized protein (TIGR00255 family)
VQKINNQWKILSMTGLGRAVVDNKDVVMEVIAKSLNQRFLEIKFRLPEELAFLESSMYLEIKNMVERGRLDIQVNIELDKPKSSSIEIDEELIEHLVKKFNGLQKKIGENISELSWRDLFSIPGIVTNVKKVLPKEEVKSIAIKALQEAVKDLIKAKEKEGKLLTLSLQKMLARCQETVISIDDASVVDVEKRLERFKSRINELFQCHKFKDERIYQELALLVERSDFKEESDRLQAHIAHFDLLCQNMVPKGRKLDFLCQEMLRECNTLLSKACDGSITIKAIDLKAQIERIREQVQNIE